ncbi:TetR/AcrR family transcriptional regulator [Segniliparus rugosus]|uniref:HTH tetR-type domain-containing protein n=1 Tax=Segniliparus rugosus (strain ATCC BAA-974 / DSM 45345 / CCUG 50838 / CIP 108380 / JCM 13579 / CDC 945) TaxID=679197 RepID=E5XQT1_SEGRC|nr:TetR/AcrR family transcriptional regulator [Segniliparus rugosus]EFV13304.1 hypothetical protein HMPREF9336_01853 [Segniliparus rugosus ATCC BAA-974]
MAVQTRREMYAAQTRAALVEAARELFISPGFGATKIEDITTKALVSKGTFYHHFPDKRVLFAEVFAEHMRTMEQALDGMIGLVGTDPAFEGKTLLVESGSAFFTFISHDDTHSGILRQAPEALGAELLRQTQRDLALPGLGRLLRLIESRGELREGVSIPTTASLLLACLSELAMIILEAEDKEAATKEAVFALERFWEGFLVRRQD